MYITSVSSKSFRIQDRDQFKITPQERYCKKSTWGLQRQNQFTSSPYICTRAFLHFRNVVFARSLLEMFAARWYMVEIACGCAAHTVFALPVAP